MLHKTTKTTGRHIFTCLGILAAFTFSGNIYAQNTFRDPAINELQKQFGDETKVVALSSAEDYTFEFTKDKKAMSPAIGTKREDEELKSLKDNLDFTCSFFYNDFEDIGKMQAFDKKNKRFDAFIVDQAEETDGSYFFTGERRKAFNLHFEDKGDKGGYTGETYYGDLKYLISAYFMKAYPILDEEISFTVPKWLNVELKEMNFDGYDIKKTVTTDPKTGDTKYTYTAKDMKAIDYSETNLPTLGSMFPHILIMCKSYTTPDGKTVNIISSVGDMYNWYAKLVSEAGNNNTNLKPLVADIIKNKTTDVDKVKALYYWVEDNVRYLAFENGISGNKPDPCQNVLQKKYGDCKGMANLLVEMLKIAGYDARRTWLSDKSGAYDYSKTPTLAASNHCICTLVLGGKHYYLDCTEKYEAFNDNADRIQGRELIIEDGAKYITETIPVASIDRSKITINRTMTVAPGDMLTGDVHKVYNGESKTEILYYYHNIPSDKKSDYLTLLAQRDDADLSTSNVKVSDLENRETPVKIDFDFKMKNQVSDFDNDSYVNIDHEKIFQYLIFDSTRQCDYQFDYRYNYVINDTLVVPAGYTVKHVPDNMDKETPGYVFKVKVTQAGNKLIYHKEFQVVNEVIKKKDFKTWNADMGDLKKIYDDQVVLTKK